MRGSDTSLSTAAAWQKLNDALELSARLAAGDAAVLVTATQIKAITGREPRLMTKFDTREGRPSTLAQATLLPVSNGTYAILPGDGYANVPPSRRARSWNVPPDAKNLGTLPWAAGPSSESQAIDMAAASGILTDFLCDAARLTIRGRLRSPRFDFAFACPRATVSLAVEGVQIEVDSGYEGEHVHLLEAKLGTRTNFHVRQLFYPFRMWQTLLPKQKVQTVFLSWHNRCLQLRRFSFEDPLQYQGLLCTGAVDYYVDEPAPVPTLAEVLASSCVSPAPDDAPFPQADDLRRVIDVVDAVASDVSTQSGIAARYEFAPRQAHYYGAAGVFLGLLQRNGRRFSLTALGRDFTCSPLSERLAIVLVQMASRPVLRQALEAAQASGGLPSQELVTELITQLTGLSGQTPRRRARTVLSWTKWALQVTASGSGLPLDTA